MIRQGRSLERESLLLYQRERRMSLKNLTRENYDSFPQRLRRRVKEWWWPVLLFILTCGSGYMMITAERREKADLAKTIERIIYESAMKGCPVFTDGKTHIVISAGSTEEARSMLGKIVVDLESFHAAINKAEGVKK